MTRHLVRDLVAAGALRVEDGNHGNDRPRPDEFVGEGVAFIRAADMTSGVVNFTGAGKISEAARQRIRKGVGAPGDVILSHKGTVGRVAVAPPDSPGFVCSPQTTFWRSQNEDVIDRRFLAYLLRSEHFQRQLAALAGQTDMAPYVSLTDQRSMTIELPAISHQRQIGELLGAIDDKIAANDGQIVRIQLLADAYFAKARHAREPVDLTFADVAVVGGGGTPSTSVEEYWGGAHPWATPTDVTVLSAPYLAGTSRTITDAGLAACSSPLYPAGSILMTSRATIGAFAVAQMPTAVNQGFIVVNANESELQWWLFHDMRSRVAEFLTFANGATFLELPRGRFKSLNVCLPHRGVIEDFDSKVKPLHALAIAFVEENRCLAKSRDKLLPLLMSGTVRVREAEHIAEGVA